MTTEEIKGINFCCVQTEGLTSRGAVVIYDDRGVRVPSATSARSAQAPTEPAGEILLSAKRKRCIEDGTPYGRFI